MTAAAANAVTGSLRCFLALLPDSATRKNLSSLRSAHDEAPANPRGLRWIDAASLHLTLRFLGETTPAQVDFLQHMLPTLAQSLCTLDARRCAIWPNRARPRLLVLELGAAPDVATTAHACELLARKAGFAPEPRAFRPHVSLARLRPGCALDTPPALSEPMLFDTLALMASDPHASGSRYRSLASLALTARTR